MIAKISIRDNEDFIFSFEMNMLILIKKSNTSIKNYIQFSTRPYPLISTFNKNDKKEYVVTNWGP